MGYQETYKHRSDVVKTVDRIAFHDLKLDPIVKDRWLHALRSGTYTQGEVYLAANGCHCCLGVLAVEDGLSSFKNGVDNPTHFKIGDTHHSVMLPPGYQGMGYNALEAFATLNDMHCLPFDEIADIIEEVL